MDCAIGVPIGYGYEGSRFYMLKGRSLIDNSEITKDESSYTGISQIKCTSITCFNRETYGPKVKIKVLMLKFTLELLWEGGLINVCSKIILTNGGVPLEPTCW